MELKKYNVDPPAVNLLASKCTGSETTFKKGNLQKTVLCLFLLWSNFVCSNVSI